MIDQLNEIKKLVINQFDSIDLSGLDNNNQAKLKTEINKLKVKVGNEDIDLQQSIQAIINEVQSFK